MFRIITCISDQHDYRLVIAAALLCAFAAYTAMNLYRRSVATTGALRIRWLGGAALATGCGIWATHFVAMLAYRQEFQAGYAITPTLASIAIAIGVSGVGFALAAYRPRLTVEAGVLVGFGIGAMHFLGMSALQIAGAVSYDLEYVIAAFAVGMICCAAALTIVRSNSSLKRGTLAALLLAFGICGLHFTAMASATIAPNPFVTVPESAINSGALAAAIIGAALLMLGMALIGSLFDQHLASRAVREAARLREYSTNLERTKNELQSALVEARRARAEAEAGLQAKSQFLAAMSHELRTPLNAVIGFSEMLGLSGSNQQRRAAYIEYIRSSGVHLLKLVNDILDFSKASDGTLKLNNVVLDVHHEVANAFTMLAQTAEKAGVKLQSFVPQASFQIRADRIRLQQILLNILSNGVKFTPKGGSVSVYAARASSTVSIRIVDTGIGIAKNDIASAFESFRQIDSRLARKYEGAGLGLALSKQLIELQGGSIAIDSEVAQGTTVTLVFPGDLEHPSSQLANPIVTVAA